MAKGWRKRDAAEAAAKIAAAAESVEPDHGDASSPPAVDPIAEMIEADRARSAEAAAAAEEESAVQPEAELEAAPAPAVISPAEAVVTGRELAEAQIARSDAPEPDHAHPPINVSTVDDLRERLAELQSTVEQLVSTAAPQPTVGSDPEIDSASRTLRFAQQTADSVIAEAREEAAAIVADAERQRSEIIRRARQQADQDYTSERDRVVAASAAWQEQRIEVLRQLESLTSVVAQYQGGLAEIDGTVTSVTNELRTGVAATPSALTPAVEADPAVRADAAVDAADTGDAADAADAADDDLLGEPGESGEAAIDVTDAHVDDADADDAPADDVAGDESADLDTDAWIAPTEATASAEEAELRPVGADTDPFMFDATELPETTGDFGWEHESPGSTTF